MSQGGQDVETVAVLRQAFGGGQGAACLRTLLDLTDSSAIALCRHGLALRELIQKALRQGGQSRLKDGGLEGLNVGEGRLARFARFVLLVLLVLLGEPTRWCWVLQGVTFDVIVTVLRPVIAFLCWV